jgi:hypothetical protein
MSFAPTRSVMSFAPTRSVGAIIVCRTKISQKPQSATLEGRTRERDLLVSFGWAGFRAFAKNDPP